MHSIVAEDSIQGIGTDNMTCMLIKLNPVSPDDETNKLMKLTGCVSTTPLSYYLDARKEDKSVRWHTINKCPVCKNTLYEDI